MRGQSPREKPPLTGEVAAKQAGRALDVSGGGGVKTPPYDVKDKRAVMARLRERVADERGKGGRQPAPSQWAEVDRERVVTQGPSESPSHLTVTAPFDKGAFFPCGGSGELPNFKTEQRARALRTKSNTAFV